MWRIDWCVAVLAGAFLAPAAWADGSVDKLARQEAAQRQALEAAIGTPRCSADSACWAVPVGARPCGGAEDYLPASRETSAATKVQALAKAHAATRKAQNAQGGRMGICMVLPEPAVRCAPSTQRCELVDAAAGAATAR
ncbi:MAG: hypothetical protein ACK520_17975 [Inhella sp.]